MLQDAGVKKNNNLNLEIFKVFIYRKNNAWEKRYCILKDNKLQIYSEEPKDESVKVLESVDLKSENTCGKIDLEPQPSEIDIPVAKSDVPFLMRVEITTNTTCWPPKYLTFLMSSYQEKEKWYLGKWISGNKQGPLTGLAEHLQSLHLFNLKT